MRRAITFIVVLTLLPAAIAAKVPADAWQTGKLTDTSEKWHSRTVGTLNSNGGLLVGRDYPIVRYVIETDAYTYEGELALRHRRDPRPSLTVNGPIKFAVVKSDLYIQDEQAKEYKLVLAKKTLKTASPQPAEQE
ncbi:MAG TPA: hypothetical protein VKR60_01655 [Candidatus Sulfotelmatobacter sp.]|nr:hypothetical protein [Candidatus Sulfotelmatobacter sp.]